MTTNYFEKFFTVAGKLFTTAKGLVLLLISSIIALSSVQKAIITLLAVYILDFITGLIASWMEQKKSGKKIKVYFFQSSKVRMSIVKGIAYMVYIICAWFITVLVFDKNVGVMMLSKKFTIVEIVAGICIANECWSIIENFKRAGFDLIAKIKEISKQAWNLFNVVKTGKEEF